MFCPYVREFREKLYIFTSFFIWGGGKFLSPLDHIAPLKFLSMTSFFQYTIVDMITLFVGLVHCVKLSHFSALPVSWLADERVKAKKEG